MGVGLLLVLVLVLADTIALPMVLVVLMCVVVMVLHAVKVSRVEIVRVRGRRVRCKRRVDGLTTAVARCCHVTLKLMVWVKMRVTMGLIKARKVPLVQRSVLWFGCVRIAFQMIVLVRARREKMNGVTRQGKTHNIACILLATFTELKVGRRVFAFVGGGGDDAFVAVCCCVFGGALSQGKVRKARRPRKTHGWSTHRIRFAALLPGEPFVAQSWLPKNFRCC